MGREQGPSPEDSEDKIGINFEFTKEELEDYERILQNSQARLEDEESKLKAEGYSNESVTRKQELINRLLERVRSDS